jgi:hypothetical protein
VFNFSELPSVRSFLNDISCNDSDFIQFTDNSSQKIDLFQATCSIIDISVSFSIERIESQITYSKSTLGMPLLASQTRKTVLKTLLAKGK